MAINPSIEPATGFRPMLFEDVARIMEIEKLIYAHPWTAGIFKDCIRVGYSCWVYEINNVIQVYGLLSIAADEAHILNLCVVPDYQGQGLGKKMLHKLLDVAEEDNVESIFLEVRVSNEVATKLYEQEGFNQLAVRPDYYPSDEGREDALVFAKTLNITDED